MNVLHVHREGWQILQCQTCPVVDVGARCASLPLTRFRVWLQHAAWPQHRLSMLPLRHAIPALPQTPLAIAGRFLAGGGEQLKGVVGEWTKTQAQGIWHPPKPDQVGHVGWAIAGEGWCSLSFEPAAAHACAKLVRQGLPLS